MKKILLLSVLLLTCGFSVNAADLTVTGSEAEDVKTVSNNIMYLTSSLTPCISNQISQTIYLPQMYYACVCKENNTIAIAGFKKIKSIYEKHPHWAYYSHIKTNDSIDVKEAGKSYYGIKSKEIKNLLNTLDPCLN